MKNLKNFEVVGHRGASFYEKENSRASFEKALELGAKAIELDVHVSRDKELIVVHDDYISGSRCEELTLEQVRNKDKDIITLDEAINIIGKEVLIDIELKHNKAYEIVADLLSKKVKKGWSYDFFIISSFHHIWLKKIQEKVPVKILPLIAGPTTKCAEYIHEIGAKTVGISDTFIDKKFIEDIHKKGIKVWVYTVNTKERANKLRKMGVDGIFSNIPDLLK